jgi:spore maturation protein CgeB
MNIVLFYHSLRSDWNHGNAHFLRGIASERAWTWHEAADIRIFHPFPGLRKQGDLVWIGNWGDGERSAELQEFLLRPVVTLGLQGRVHGVRYPKEACEALAAAGIEYAGWVPNYEVPQVYARFRVTVHFLHIWEGLSRRPAAAAQRRHQPAAGPAPVPARCHSM